VWHLISVSKINPRSSPVLASYCSCATVPDNAVTKSNRAMPVLLDVYMTVRCFSSKLLPSSPLPYILSLQVDQRIHRSHGLVHQIQIVERTNNCAPLAIDYCVNQQMKAGIRNSNPICLSGISLFISHVCCNLRHV